MNILNRVSQRNPLDRERSVSILYGLAAAIALATFLLYLPALQNGFVEWDDTEYIIENSAIRSLDGRFLHWAFTTFHAANWHPFTWISHALDYAVWGLNPLGHHLTNNILHALNTFLVVLLVGRLIEALSRRQPSGSTIVKRSNGANQLLNYSSTSRFIMIPAGITGLLFGIHPVHVESVAWVAERKDLLCALFYLLTLMEYIKYKSLRSHKAYFLSLILFALALLSKPMAISLPLVLLIIDWYPFQNISSVKALLNSLMEKIPFIVLSAGSAVMTLMAQSGAMENLEPVELQRRLVVAAASLISYLGKMLFPLVLIPYYPYPKSAPLLSPDYLIPFLLVLGITTAAIMTLKRNRLWTAAWAYFVITLIPVLGLVRVGGQSMADRYMYLPGLALFLIAGLAAEWMVKKANAHLKRHFLLTCLAAFSLVAVCFLSYLTIRQIGVWKDSITLWSDVIEKHSSEVAFPFNNRGIAYEKSGRLDLAIEDFTRAISLNPGYYRAYNNRGAALQKAGRRAQAAEDFTRAISLNPSYYDAYHNLGILYGSSGDLTRAREYFDITLRLNPGYAQAYNNRGYIYFLQGRYAEALHDFNKAISLDQHFAQFYMNRAKLYLLTGQKDHALADLKKTCDLGYADGCRTLQSYGQ